MTGVGPTLQPGFVLLRDGLIEVVGSGEPSSVTNDVEIVNAHGAYVTAGLIDVHSHMGVFALPEVTAHRDGNETSAPVTAQVAAEHGFWPQDPSLRRALAGGVTAIQVLPGSANLIGGRSFVVKLRPGVSAAEMRFPGAPEGLKMACGENPKRVYRDKGGPVTRMGNVAGYRAAFIKAAEYRQRWAHFRAERVAWERAGTLPEKEPLPPDRDLGLETLEAVLDGRILVHLHCYRADEMALMLDVADELGFRIRSFEHALEAYKIRAALAANDVAASTWADWWGFKMEAFDGIPQNAAMVSAAGARAVIHSDSQSDVRHLNQEAAKARTAGRKVGIEIDEQEALRWVTANPAWVLGVEDRVGTLETGKMADVVLWSAHPLSVYALARQVYIDGERVFDRDAPTGTRLSDFELGQPALEGTP